MDNSDLTARIIRLEENFYFLERKITSLDEHAMTQQRQLDAMQKDLQAVISAFQAIRNQLDYAQKAHAAKEEIPPHHEPRLW